ncbi:hypothetical protein OG225_40840 (plasmid) [Nocardia sp. NBC_01377]|uniref:hypothetical protein n=1 Tax=Nocardia sp. NBC_01377 TaxID=2903595 RepID=UPI002F910839
MRHDRVAAGVWLPVDDAEVLLALLEESEPVDVDDVGARLARRVATRWARQSGAVSRAEGSAVLRIPGWAVQVRAAASKDNPVVQARTDREVGVEFTRTVSAGQATRLTVRSFAGWAVPGDVVRVAVDDDANGCEVLVVLYRDEHDNVAGQVVTGSIGMTHDLRISVFAAEGLEAGQARMVTEAVRGSATAGRNAWRRVAKGLPEGDPVRAAILAGLG